MDELVQCGGQPGPMVLAMANAPALLRGYLDLTRAMKRSHIDPGIVERINLAVHEWLGCDYCLVAHTRAARRLGVPEGEIVLARRGTSRDPAIAAFAQQVLARPAEIVHDGLMTGGVYALTGREVTASRAAALLTILGFSLYDTVVVFDRVRENIPLPILALLLFGGETLQDFAFALLVGTISGTYSSVFIAGPVLTHWKEREPVYQARDTCIRAEFGAVPAYVGVAASEPAKPRHRRPR